MTEFPGFLGEEFSHKNQGAPYQDSGQYLKHRDLIIVKGVTDKLSEDQGRDEIKCRDLRDLGLTNSVISAAIEHKTEGYVLGVGGNMFKLAGSVIVFGVFSAFVVALIKTILIQLGVI